MDAGGREFRFRGDLYSQESTFPLVLFLFLVSFLYLSPFIYDFVSYIKLAFTAYKMAIVSYCRFAKKNVLTEFY